MLISNHIIKPSTVKSYIKTRKLSHYDFIHFFKDRYLTRYIYRWELMDILSPYLKEEERKIIIQRFEETLKWAKKMDEEDKKKNKRFCEYLSFPNKKDREFVPIVDNIETILHYLKKYSWNGLEIKDIYWF